MSFIPEHEFLMTMPGVTEWVVVIVIILIFFGGKKIPGLMRGLGKGVKDFNDARKGKDSEQVKNDDSGKISSGEK